MELLGACAAQAPTISFRRFSARPLRVGSASEDEYGQERLPDTFALQIALRMLVAWIEPPFLVCEAQALLSEAGWRAVGFWFSDSAGARAHEGGRV